MTHRAAIISVFFFVIHNKKLKIFWFRASEEIILRLCLIKEKFVLMLKKWTDVGNNQQINR